MKKLLSFLILSSSVVFFGQSMADDVDHPQKMTKEQMMDACMKKLLADDSSTPEAARKKICMANMSKMKESTGPVAGTIDPTKP